MPTDENNYDVQVRLVEAALTALGSDRPHRVSEIREWLQANHRTEFESLEASWGSYLSRAVTDPGNRIERTPGKYTYSLRPTQSISPPPVEAPTAGGADGSASPVQAARQQRELLLYPAIATWLRSRGYGARVTAPLKKGGIWGNPDVTGIQVVDGFLGQKSLEIATVEAKLGSDQWRYYFFEAVAHKRFAHRAYFAFAQGSDEPSLADIEDAHELREYGEKYHVGIIVVFIPVDRYSTLTIGQTEGIELTLDEVRIEELWPAVYDNVTAAAQATFLHEVLGIREDRDIYLFDPEPR